MATKKVSAMTAAAALGGTEKMHCVQSGGSVRTTAAAIANLSPLIIQMACSDLSTAITADTDVGFCRAPQAFTLTAVRAALLGAAGSGTFTVDINKNGTTVLSTKLTIDATEKTSVTAATAAVISVSSFANDDIITVDIDDDASGDAIGLVITLIGTPT
jgi:hypothetical protein